jgi:hypothetical protein
MEERDNSPIYRCPHCGKCCAVADEHDECIFIALHKTTPPRRPYSLRLLAKRRCAHSGCKKDFVVESYASIADILHWLIFSNPNALAHELCKNNAELLKKLRQDKVFMKMINNGISNNAG